MPLKRRWLLAAAALPVALLLAFLFFWITREEPAPYANVRWAPGVSGAEIAVLERRYSLELIETRERRTRAYWLLDPATDNIQRLLADPAVEDTHGIDRTTARPLQVPSPPPFPWALALRAGLVAWLTVVLVWTLVAPASGTEEPRAIAWLRSGRESLRSTGRSLWRIAGRVRGDRLARHVPSGILLIPILASATGLSLAGTAWWWRPAEASLAEAAAWASHREVHQRLAAGADPDHPGWISPGIVADEPTTLRPLEAAVWARDVGVLGLLLRADAEVDETLGARLSCLARHRDAADIHALLVRMGHRPTLEECRNLEPPW